jgi:hypothetical protein
VTFDAGLARRTTAHVHNLPKLGTIEVNEKQHAEQLAIILEGPSDEGFHVAPSDAERRAKALRAFAEPSRFDRLVSVIGNRNGRDEPRGANPAIVAAAEVVIERDGVRVMVKERGPGAFGV